MNSLMLLCSYNVMELLILQTVCLQIFPIHWQVVQVQLFVLSTVTATIHGQEVTAGSVALRLTRVCPHAIRDIYHQVVLFNIHSVFPMNDMI